MATFVSPSAVVIEANKSSVTWIPKSAKLLVKLNAPLKTLPTDSGSVLRFSVKFLRVSSAALVAPGTSPVR